VATGHPEKYVTDRTGHKSHGMVQLYARAVCAHEQAGLGAIATQEDHMKRKIDPRQLARR
jgi:hypothetical protein